jgi:hypothetical protein
MAFSIHSLVHGEMDHPHHSPFNPYQGRVRHRRRPASSKWRQLSLDLGILAFCGLRESIADSNFSPLRPLSSPCQNASLNSVPFAADIPDFNDGRLQVFVLI